MSKVRREEVLADRAAGELRLSTLQRDWAANRNGCQDEGFEFETYVAWRKYEAERADIPFIDDSQSTGSQASGTQLRSERVADQTAGELRTSTIDRDWKARQSSLESEGFTAETYAAWRKYEANRDGLQIIEDGNYVPPTPTPRPPAIATAVPASQSVSGSTATHVSKSIEQNSKRSPRASVTGGDQMTSSLGWATGPGGKRYKVRLFAADGDQTRVYADVTEKTWPNVRLVARTAHSVPRSNIHTELAKVAQLTDIEWSCHKELAPMRTQAQHSELIAGG